MNRGTALTEEQGQNAIIAIRRLHELNKQTILTPNLEGEKVGLQKFIGDVVSQHADELLACWSAVRFEYEPFVGSLSLVFDRVTSIRRSRLLANQMPAQPPENDTKPLTQDDGRPTPDATDSAAQAEPSNIIHVTR